LGSGESVWAIDMECRFKKTRWDAIVPRYARDGDSGMDLSALDPVTLFDGDPVLIDTGIAIELPPGYEAQVRPRSSMTRSGVVCGFGTVDNGYRGNICAVLTYRMRTGTPGTYEVKRGDRVAQLVIAPVARVELVEAEDLSATARGEGGFGSSGR
jgi:dUTP pyrophosphatase